MRVDCENIRSVRCSCNSHASKITIQGMMCYKCKKSKDIKLKDFATGYQTYVPKPKLTHGHRNKGYGYIVQRPAAVSCTTVM